MKLNRQAAEKLILETLKKMDKSGDNTKMYAEFFAQMSDKEFEQWRERLKSGQVKLRFTVPNFGRNAPRIEDLFKIGDELGVKFHQRVWTKAPDGTEYLTPNEELVLLLPLRRQAQVIDKKLSVTEDASTVNDLTGQPTGKSKSAALSFMETRVLSEMGMQESLVELLKYRGGDERGFLAMNTMIDRTGRVSMRHIEPYSSGVKSTQTLRMLLLGAHLSSTLENTRI